MPLRIMFMANAPWACTGYGIQGRYLTPRWKALGHEVAYFAFYGLQGGRLNLGDIPIYPMGLAPWGEDILDAHMQDFKADVLISLMDVWVQDYFGRHAKAGGWKFLPWLPVDQEPCPKAIIDKLDGAYMALPYARFGEKMLRQAGVKNVRYIPHGVDTQIYSPGDRRAARKKLKLPLDAFVIGMVAANKGYPPRKGFPEQFEAFAQFKKRHPEAFLYVHTLSTGANQGLDLEALAKACGIPDDSIGFCDQYRYVMGFPDTWMAETYRAMDVLSECSYAEGFGIPLIEAQACGTPVISTGFSSMPELTWSGYTVSRGHRLYTLMDAWVLMPEPRAITEAYEHSYDDLNEPDSAHWAREKAVAGAQAYSWDVVVNDYWKPLLEEVEKALVDERSRELALQPA